VYEAPTLAAPVVSFSSFYVGMIFTEARLG